MGYGTTIQKKTGLRRQGKKTITSRLRNGESFRLLSELQLMGRRTADGTTVISESADNCIRTFIMFAIAHQEERIVSLMSLP